MKKFRAKSILVVLLAIFIVVGIGYMYKKPGPSQVAQSGIDKESLTPAKEVVDRFPSVVLENELENNRDDPFLEKTSPKITVIDEKKGEYALQWLGRDHQPKEVIYTRPDTIDVSVSVSVKSGESKAYRYIYELHNKKTSGQYLAGFVVQSFDNEAIPIVEPGVYVGKMASNIVEFSDGKWISFGNPVMGKNVIPGSTKTVIVESDMPPVVVDCRVHGGSRKMKGAGEDMPLVLENTLLGYDAWPKGITLGPSGGDIDATSYINQKSDLKKYLPQFVSAGWVTSEKAREYESILATSIEKPSLVNKLQQDIDAGEVAPEVLLLISQLTE